MFKFKHVSMCVLNQLMFNLCLLKVQSLCVCLVFIYVIVFVIYVYLCQGRLYGLFEVWS
jgi:hypothetical protein